MCIGNSLEFAVATCPRNWLRHATRISPRDSRDGPTPADLPQRVESLGILEEEQRFGLAIAALLPVVGLHRIAAEMPDKGGRAVAKRVTTVEHAPAYIDVVTGGR